MNEKLLKPYDSKQTEERIYKLWEESGFFNPDNLPARHKEYFSIVLPPPNVTGTLHLGHALEDSIQDMIVRYKRMAGFKTLWVPGTDHAAIATQSKVEKEIQKKEGKSRYDLGREEMLRRIKEFAQASHDTIITQIKKMGATLDWSREAFTFDEKRNEAVKTAFKQMYDAGLIYRGNKIVNWDPKGQTTISDDEIVYEERKAKMYTFKYSQDFPISISTTRPETKVGDVAVAVHPDDKHYKKFIGKEFDLEFCGVPIHLKIIEDKEVDPEFGTGALGVTPAHSMVDWEMADRHDLPRPQVINEYAKMMVGGENLLGKKTTEARETIVAWLKEEGLLEKEEEINQNIGTAERTGGIIEPLPKLQWFINVNKPIKTRENKTLKDLMREPVDKNEIKIIPDHFGKVYFNWIENLRDWCISRQIWYGHRIPVWYCLGCGEISVNNKPKSKWFLVRHGETNVNKEKRLYSKSEEKNSPLNEEGLKQAEEGAQKLKNEKIDLIISSPYLRAKQTAEAIAKVTGAELILEDEFREREYGDAEGMLLEDVKTNFPNFYEYDDKSANHENYKEMEERMWNSFSKHYSVHKDKNVVIVGHGGAFRSLLRKIKNVEPSEIRTKIPFLLNVAPLSLEILDPCPKCKSHFFEQDEDTLDTWFSSGLWTFSTLGWPDKTKDLKNFHPTTLINPGYEILFFWVARMILMSQFLLGEIPFKTVFLHGILRDKNGKKFSKSSGNNIDPTEIIEKYGADALRMSLISGTGAGNDSNFDENKVKGYKNFANKIWNITRFILENVEEKYFEDKISDKLIDDFEKIKKDITSDMENYRFHLAAEKIYHYIWHSFADEIIEESKKIIKDGGEKSETRKKVLVLIWVDCLKILYPFMPFVTEEIWSMLPIKNKKLLLIEDWPQ